MCLYAQKHGGRINWFAISCYQSIIKNGTIPYPYIFVDREDRNICILFSDSCIIAITNRTKINPEMLFTDVYKIHFETNSQDVNYIVVDELINSNRKISTNKEVINPFDYDEEPVDCSNLFPILNKGTIIRAEQHYQYLSVDKFIFKAQQYSEADAKEYEIWLWKMIESENNPINNN